jgi:dTDP-4-dehydrorhamnose reductase
MLGTALQRVLREAGLYFQAPPERSFDITDPECVDEVVGAFSAEGSGVLLNAAAYTNVERAEDEPEIAYRVNEEGSRLLAEAARAHGLAFAHVSTDFVFDGTKGAPYVETDAPHPLSVYGASKLDGEVAVASVLPDALIVRTAWVFGENGVNFPSKILERANSADELTVVTDEVGTPTYTVDLARGILGLLDAGAGGMFHLVGGGSCSRFELAAEVLRDAGLDRRLIPATSDAFPTKAERPRYSVLSTEKAAALGVTMPDWNDALRRYVTGVPAQ